MKGMRELGKKGTAMFVALGFILSVLAVFSPTGAAAGRAGNFTVNITYKNETEDPITTNHAPLGSVVTVVANVSTSVDATEFELALLINSEVYQTNYTGSLIVGEFIEHSWDWNTMAFGYGPYTINVVAINGTDDTSKTVTDSQTFTIDAVDFNVQSVTVTPTSGLVGITDFSIAAEIQNSGTIAGTANVSFKLDNSQLLGYKEVQVGATATATATLVTNLSGLTITDGNHTVTAVEAGGSSAVSDNFTLTNPTPDVMITGVEASPNPVTIEKGMTLNVTVTAHLKNNGTLGKSGFEVKFYETDATTPKEVVTVPGPLDPGATMDLAWNWTITDSVTLGEHTIYVGVDPESAEPYWMYVVVTVNGLAAVAVSNLTATPASAFENDNVTLTAKLANNGTADGINVTVQFFDGETLINTTIVALVPHGTETIVPSVTANIGNLSGDANKTYKVKVGSSEMTVTVAARDRVPKIEVLAFSVGDGRIGDTVTFSATVKNNGTGDAVNIAVDFYDGGAKVGSSAAFNLTVLSSRDVTASIKLSGTPDANHTFSARVATYGVLDRNVTKMVNHTLSPASFVIISMTVKPTKLEGQPKDSTQNYKITIVVRNSGESRGQVNLTLTEGKNVITVIPIVIALDGGAEYNTSANPIIWKVKGDGEHKCLATLSAGPLGSPSTKEVKVTLRYTPGFEVLAMVGAIILALALVRRGKNRGGSS